MARSPGDTPDRKQILGIRVTPKLRRSVKVEAAERGMTVAELFQEMWGMYLDGRHAQKG